MLLACGDTPGNSGLLSGARQPSRSIRGNAYPPTATSQPGREFRYLACAIGIAACHNGQRVSYWRMDDLARKLVITRTDAIAHQAVLNDLSDTGLLIIDDFLTVGVDPDAASDLFTILANREHRRPTMVASQSGPDYWAAALPDKVAADSIVNRLVNNARTIALGDIDMRRERDKQARAAQDYWE